MDANARPEDQNPQSQIPRYRGLFLAGWQGTVIVLVTAGEIMDDGDDDEEEEEWRSQSPLRCQPAEILKKRKRRKG